MKRKYWLFCAAAAIAAVVPLRASAQAVAVVKSVDSQKAESEKEEVPVTRLVLTPSLEPREALKYRLLPNVLDMKSGNAAVLYNKYALGLKDQPDWKEDEQKISDWRELPLAELPREEVARMLAKYEYIVQGVSFAAVRQHCDWQLPLGEMDFISILLPELQPMRSIARLLALKARLQIADGEFDEAIRTLQTGYAMGRHMKDGQTLIHGLVGIAICRMMSEEVQLLIQQPKAPNMYWALTSLPRPLVDLRRAAETEMNLLYYTFPELRQIDDKRQGQAYWQNFTDQLARRFAEWSSQGEFAREWQSRLMITALAIRGYPMARQALIEQGRSLEEIEAMPVPQVVAVYTLHTYNEYRDDVFKWFMVPYSQSRAGSDRAQDRLRKEAGQREIVPLASLLLPAVNAANLAVARNERDFALLRTIEAIRIHGAALDGRLPDRLDDIHAVPVPIDPVSGRPFVYVRTGDKAILQTPPPETDREQRYQQQYEIRFHD
ncbi:MAG: hypothetical protein JXB62_23765 [Pirellulales bacterium]|nr:hypothetical protein [Pirellulales bacterium]